MDNYCSGSVFKNEEIMRYIYIYNNNIRKYKRVA